MSTLSFLRLSSCLCHFPIDSTYRLLLILDPTSVVFFSCFLGAFADVRKEVIGFIMSVRPQETPLLPLNEIS
jgi:hypothetical protein